MSSEGAPQLSEADRKIAAQQALLRGVAERATKQLEQAKKQKVQVQKNENKKMEHDRIVSAAHLKKEKEKETHRALRKKVIQPLSSPSPKKEVPQIDPRHELLTQRREEVRSLRDDRRKVKRAAAMEYATTVRSEGLLQKSTANEDAAREEIRKLLYTDIQTKHIEELRHKQRQEQSIASSVKRNFLSRLPFFKK